MKVMYRDRVKESARQRKTETKERKKKKRDLERGRDQMSNRETSCLGERETENIDKRKEL